MTEELEALKRQSLMLNNDFEAFRLDTSIQLHNNDVAHATEINVMKETHSKREATIVNQLKNDIKVFFFIRNILLLLK